MRPLSSLTLEAMIELVSQTFAPIPDPGDSSGAVHFRHTVVSGTLVKAGSHRVLPLDVEEVRNEDGQDKQDCEINAAKGLIPRLRHEHPQLALVIGGDDLYCHEPFILQLREHRRHHVLVCKPGSHSEVYREVEAQDALGQSARGRAQHDGEWCARPTWLDSVAKVKV